MRSIPRLTILLLSALTTWMPAVGGQADTIFFDLSESTVTLTTRVAPGVVLNEARAFGGSLVLETFDPLNIAIAPGPVRLDSLSFSFGFVRDRVVRGALVGQAAGMLNATLMQISFAPGALSISSIGSTSANVATSVFQVSNLNGSIIRRGDATIRARRIRTFLVTAGDRLVPLTFEINLVGREVARGGFVVDPPLPEPGSTTLLILALIAIATARGCARRVLTGARTTAHLSVPDR